jgi:hypothetical protein
MAQILDKPTYNLIINSSDKIYGTNNNATFQINWDDFLPRKFNMYKVIFSFQTTGGYYKDNTATPIVYSAGKVYINTLGRSFSFDTSTKSPSTMLGIIQRDIQTTTSSSNCLSCFYLQNAPRTISRPNQNLITIQIYNTYTGQLLTNTDNSANSVPTADMTSWTMLLDLIPVDQDEDPVK